MLICPDCRNPIESLSCSNCDWRSSSSPNDKILNLLGRKDLNDSIFKLYLENYDQICNDDLEESVLPQKYLRHNAKSLVKQITIDLKNRKICDIGSGQGFLIEELRAKGGNNITAVDICDKYLNNLPLSVRCIKANAENLPFEQEFDIIIATDILEHVLNVGSFLYCINKALKPDGIIYIRVPYNENLMSYSSHLKCPYTFVHLRSFNKSLFKKVLVDSGFQPIRVYYDGFSVLSPNSFWDKNKNIYKKIINFLARFEKSEGDLAFWPSWFCRIFMRPYEITIKARKTKNVF
ncbi:MAG: class I SAM-dependent methyltransferase [Rickettsiales bacterium]|nr:class I SAM-dependent methyltransferase [Rickettsiales bacterium]